MAHTGDTDTSMPGQSQASPVDKPDTTIPDHAQASPADKADDHDANDEPDKDYAARFKEKVRRKRIERGLPVTPEFANFPLEEGKNITIQSLFAHVAHNTCQVLLKYMRPLLG